MWWGLQTLTSVGYGDFPVETIVGKLLAAMTAVCGVLVMALPIPIVVDNFADYYQEQKKIEAQELKEEAKVLPIMQIAKLCLLLSNYRKGRLHLPSKKWAQKIVNSRQKSPNFGFLMLKNDCFEKSSPPPVVTDLSYVQMFSSFSFSIPLSANQIFPFFKYFRLNISFPKHFPVILLFLRPKTFSCYSSVFETKNQSIDKSLYCVLGLVFLHFSYV